MIYEVREYVAVPGRLGAIIELYQEATAPMLAKYGIETVAAGRTWMGDHSFNEVVFINKFEDVADLDRKWSAVLSDPEWVAALQAREAEGPMVQSMRRRVIDDDPFAG